MNWNDIPAEVREKMKFLGDFAPVNNAAEKMMKGYKIDDNGEGGKEYISNADLRIIGNACFYMAAWLEIRAEQQEREAAQ